MGKQVLKEEIIINRVILIGRLTKDPELRYTSNNIACAEVDIAINNGKDDKGEERPADFIRVVFWDKLAENLAKYQHKGSQIAVEGQIKVQDWEDDSGKRRYKTYVLVRNMEFLDSKKSESPLPEVPDYLKNMQDNSDPYAEMSKQVSMDDYSADSEDLPF